MVVKKQAKAAIKKAGLKRFKKDVDANSVFYLADGKVIKNLHELALMMDEMPDHVFYHHVNDHRNDFSSWIREAIEELELAEELMRVRDRKDYHVKLLKFIIKSS